MRRPSARSQTGARPGRQRRRTPRPNPSQRAAETGRGPLRWVLGEGPALPMAGQDSALSTSHPFYDVARHGILQVAGDDRCGRLIVTFSCCRMPPSHELNHQRLLEYLKFTLDQYVENDYSLVYFHHGLHGGNKPSLGWLQSTYKEFDRKYKKNLKAVYVVHPTSFIKVLWKLFKPLISHKFGKKVTYCSSLRELREHLQCDQLPIPQEVLRYDEKLRDLHSGLPPPATKKPPPRPPLPTQQFGVSLQYLRDKNQGALIPPVLQLTVTYLREKGEGQRPARAREQLVPAQRVRVHPEHPTGQGLEELEPSRGWPGTEGQRHRGSSPHSPVC
ncbi:rho GTPase-activating protein 8 isoform X1 [Ictidomys tridecemlineatus]